MVELAERYAEAAWKMGNLGDYDRRLERAARRVDEINKEHDTAALTIYEAALMRSGKPVEEVRETVRSFRQRYEDEDDPLTIPRVSGIMNIEGGEWFFGDEKLRATTGRLLGQFQHRVAQYNYISEPEVLRRWADSHDTRLFIRRRVHGTEPVVGVVPGFDLYRMQYLRVIGGGNTLVPTDEVEAALQALGFDESEDGYETLARAEGVALHLDLPAPVVGEMLEDVAREGVTGFPELPEPAGEEPKEAGEEGEPDPGPDERAARESAREDPAKGEEPTRAQDPQAKEAPGVEEETGFEPPASPETGKEDAPGAADEPEEPRREE